MNAFKDLISLILFVISLLILYKTTNHTLSLLIIITITVSYIIKHYTLNNFLKKELTNQVNMLEKLFNASSDIIIYLDLDMKIITFNSALVETFNFNKNQIKGVHLKKLLQQKASNPQRLNKIWQNLEQKINETIVTKRSVKYYEDYYPKDDKNVAYFNMLIFPAINSNKKVKGTILVARNVTEEYGAKINAVEKEKQLKCILENMPLCAYLKDKNDRFIVGSSSFEKFVDVTDNAEVRQLQLSDVYDKDYIEIIKKEEADIYKNKKILSVERQVVLPKQTFWGRIRKIPVINTNGEVSALVVMYENIESEKEMERQKEYFIETLIHDLKIPTLAQLRGLELIERGALGKINKDQRELVEEIQDSCKYILNMISMVLNTYRFENGQNRLIYEKFCINSLLLDCFNEISPLAQEKNINFTYSSTQENTTIDADKAEIKKVIINLLSNAIVYSNKNESINVDISTENNYLKFNITSKGIRLSERECTNIFNKVSVDNSPKYTTIGHGIALYLCKKIIDLHNGKIYATTDGKDTNSFTFVIPQFRPELKPQKASPLFI